MNLLFVIGGLLSLFGFLMGWRIRGAVERTKPVAFRYSEATIAANIAKAYKHAIKRNQ